MGQNVPLWFQRSDAVTVTLYGPWMDASSIRDMTLFVSVLALGTATVALSAEQTLDPNNPNAATALGSTVTGNAVNNFSGVIGGYSSGSTVAMPPFVRVKAVVTVSAGAIVWSANAVLRD